ncbi:SPOR domain-containing protein [Microbulbifer sp. ALW1]|uniref:SPOR domain-containing protein n=1 Tax=Microbulbifer sp. (strain ALW1) TaxID=1516059 RepID=UPI00135AFE4B|nr:SPOR domain-containing protein [Microbulbifer sp. ALW1]
MRWIFLLLVVANLGLLGWFLTAERSPSAVTVSAAGSDDAAGITLVDEADPDSLVQPEAPTANAARPPVVSGGVDSPRTTPASPSEPLCTLVGPFGEAYQGEDVARRLQALQVTAALREIEMQGQMRYWVYLAPLNSSQEAFRKLRELQAAGIDSYVIPKGSLENGISFGIFSEVERAQALAEELKERGFRAQYREEPQTYLERWVVVDGDAEGQIAEAFWEQLQLDYPEIDRRQNLCSEIREAGDE